MDKITEFPKQKKEQVYKLDECAGCHKDIKEGENFTTVSLPYEKRVEHIALCPSCSGISRQHGVNV